MHKTSITFNGITDTPLGWSRRTGINVTAIRGRLRLGWPIERILTEPVHHRRSDREPKERAYPPDVAALETVIEALLPLSTRERHLVIAYACDRFLGSKELWASVPPLEAADNVVNLADRR